MLNGWISRTTDNKRTTVIFWKENNHKHKILWPPWRKLAKKTQLSTFCIRSPSVVERSVLLANAGDAEAGTTNFICSACSQLIYNLKRAFLSEISPTAFACPPRLFLKITAWVFAGSCLVGCKSPWKLHGYSLRKWLLYWRRLDEMAFSIKFKSARKTIANEFLLSAELFARWRKKSAMSELSTKETSLFEAEENDEVCISILMQKIFIALLLSTVNEIWLKAKHDQFC